MPAEVGEAGEVAVVGVNDGAVLDGDGGDGGVGDEVSLEAGVSGELVKNSPVQLAWVKNTNSGDSQPIVDDRLSLPEAQRILVDCGIGEKAEEGMK